MLKTAGEQMGRKAHAVSRDLTVETLMERVAEHFNVATLELKSASKVRQVAFARKIFCVFAVRNLGASCVELSGILGLSPSAVSKAVATGGGVDGLEELRRRLLR